MSTTTGARFDCPDSDELEHDDAWWEIYRESFPANEREAPSVILDALQRGIGIAFRARREHRAVGIATTHLLLHPAAVFLVYLAVHPKHRAGGVGGELLEYAWSVSRSRLRERGSGPIGMIWEVDPPGGLDDPGETAGRERRIAFFQRHGGTRLPLPYVQPPLDGGSPVPMQLMFRPAANRTQPDSAAIRALASAMYFEKYGAVNGISQEILAALLAGHTIPRNIETGG